MIEILRNQNQITKPVEIKHQDIIVTKYEERETYDGNKKIIEQIPIKTNLTKKIQETAKLVKANSAIEKMTEIEDAFKVQMKKS